MADGLWLYGVLGGDAPEPPPLEGPDGHHRVQVLRHAGLAALVAAVPLEEFGAEALRQRLEDLERLEALARAHEQVLDVALGLGPVVPFRLCTIYESADGVRAMLEHERTGLASALARLDGMVELGVKGFLARGPVTGAERPTAMATSGTDYLARKRAARDAAEAERGATADTAAAVHAQLAEHAADAVVSRPQDRRLTGRDEEMVLNAAYLVPAARADEFRALVGSLASEHASEGLELQATGPWPAYHFVGADELA
jgi:hypothetical protein